MTPRDRSTRAARRRRRPRITPGRIALLWAVAMAPLLMWGLPDTTRDDLLFGGEPPWPPERYRLADDLARLRERDEGADTDLNPLVDRERLIELTTNDAARAEILRRYRLFSRQPDEMIIFRALQRMNPRALDFDPRLYQYGGGYIYLIGAALGAAAVPGLVQITGDAGVYLIHPEAFARFYVVARLVSLAFGALTLVAVHRLARRAGGHRAGWIALVCVAACPVFITAVLEAKPHLPAACMILWATLSALDYHARRRARDAWRLGLQAGYAAGLVLTGLAAAILWPVLALARRRLAWSEVRVLVAAAAVGVGVCVLMNPYALHNTLTGRGALRSNLANSLAMYEDQAARAGVGALRVGELLIEGAGVGVPVLGLVGLILLARRRLAASAIAAAAGVAMLALCVFLAADKPAEFARFLILPVLLLSCAAAWCLAAIGRRRAWLGGLAVVLVLLTMRTPAYLRAFITDARGVTESRLQAGQFLAQCLGPDDVIGVLQEPAPYAVPPLDFAHRRVVLLPLAPPKWLVEADLPTWLVFTADDAGDQRDAWWQPQYRQVARFPGVDTALSRITWADKPTFVYRRTSVLTPSTPAPSSANADRGGTVAPPGFDSQAEST